MFDFDVLEEKYAATTCGESFDSTASTSSDLSGRGSSPESVTTTEDSDSEADVAEASQVYEKQLQFFDFDELEEAEASVGKTALEKPGLPLGLALESRNEPEVCVTPGAAAADAVAKSLAQLVNETTEATRATSSTPSPKNLFLFDWDDTLCPTSWIEHRPELKRSALERRTNQSQRTGEAWDQLAEQARAVGELVRAAQCVGQVVLVTLAQRPWVDVSIGEFMPEAKDELCKLDIFYARESFADSGRHPAFQLGIGCPWTGMKKRAMQQALKALSNGNGECQWDSIISVGDSEVERRAAKELGRELESRGTVKWTKTVKLAEHPTVMKLTEQTRALSKQLAELATFRGHRHIDSRELLTRA